jgi:glc operon protein GlcG
VNHHTSLSHTDAEQAIIAMKADLERRGQAAVLAVADHHGEIISVLRMDGAPLPSLQIAMNKAWTAARERKPSREIGQAARDPKDGFDVAYFGDKRYIGWGGGLPVMLEGACVGSVAVSGLPEMMDIEIAQIGLNAILEG